MPWAPQDPATDRVFQQLLARAREHALTSFTADRRRIEIEQAAKNALGGVVLSRCGDAAETAIRSFAGRIVPELLDILVDMYTDQLPSEALDWVRITVQDQIDNLVSGFGSQIDGLKSGARVKGATERLIPAGRVAKRDVEIEIGKLAIRSRAANSALASVLLPLVSPSPLRQVGGAGAMYNLLVSSSPSDWCGAPFGLERDRCLEFTDEEVRKQLGDFSANAISRLVRFPCIFAYEDPCERDPLFGVIRAVVPRDHDIRIEYEILTAQPFITQADFRDLHSALMIEHTEYFRTHWAVKEVDLQRVLLPRGVRLPPPETWRHPVNISTHHFEVALSFPGENRPFVKQVADKLDDMLGADRCFYDENYTAQLAQPDLDLLLQGIYRERSRLVVVFLSEAYERKKWCAGVEFRAIREILASRDRARVMFVKMDEGAVKGVFSIDGAVDGPRHGPEAIARMIKQRVDLLT